VAGVNDPSVFRAHLDTIFQAEDEAGMVPLRLVDVADQATSHGMRQFSLFFHGPGDRLLPAVIHTLRHDALGTLAIFIVPVTGSNAERIIYQACFSAPAPPVR
jgi:hypothetical protein